MSALPLAPHAGPWEDIDPADAQPGEYVRSIYTYDGVVVTVEGWAVERGVGFQPGADPLWVPFGVREGTRHQRVAAPREASA